MDKPKFAVGLVVPCFNEAARFRPDAYASFLAAHPEVFLCFVEDGSTDATLERLQAFAASQPVGCVRVITSNEDKNRGKAEAVREGVRNLLQTPDAFAAVGFWDADLATPLEELPRFLAALDKPSVAVVIGNRERRAGARVRRSLLRLLAGVAVKFVIHAMIGLPIGDTQCGAKVFRTAVAGALFRQRFVSRWLFDVELFLRFRGVYGPEAMAGRIVELPLNGWHDVPGSKLGLRDTLKIFHELRAIRRYYRQHWVHHS